MKPLISIVLIAHPELAKRLSPNNAALREVAQRIEIVTLTPIDTEIDNFLKHRLQRAGSTLERVVDRGGLDAIRSRLSDSSWSYPLAVQNLLGAAMNLAAEMGAPVVTAEIIKEVVR